MEQIKLKRLPLIIFIVLTMILLNAGISSADEPIILYNEANPLLYNNQENPLFGNVLITGPDGNVISIDSAGKVIHYNGSSWEDWGKPDGNAGNQIKIAPNGTVYILAGNTVYYRSGGFWISTNGPAKAYAGINIWNLYIGADGTVWVVQEARSDDTGRVYASKYSGSWSTSLICNTYGGYAGEVYTGSDGVPRFTQFNNNSIQGCYFNGSSWINDTANTSCFPYGRYGYMIDKDNSLVCCYSGKVYKYTRSGTTWVQTGVIEGAAGNVCIAPDGSIWGTNGGSIYQAYFGRAPQTIYTANGAYGPDGYYFTYCSTGITAGPAGVYFTDRTNLRRFNTTSLSAVQSPNGTTGQLVINPQSGSRFIGNALIQASTDGSSFNDLYTCIGGATTAVTPTSDNYYIKARLYWRWGNCGAWNYFYSNTVNIPALKAAPTVTATSGIQTADPTCGRDWVGLSWPALAGASGYKLWIYDGNTYQMRDLGMATNWNSHTALIFPAPASLPQNNSVAANLFRWDGSGLDFEDTAVRLYKSTVGSAHDSDPKYYFKITAYNPYMETNINAATSFINGIQLPNGTIQVPVTAISLNTSAVTVNTNATATLTATILPANATNKTVVWSTSNPSVATVDAAGKVTGIAAGCAVITATSQDGGKTASCAVTVLAGGAAGGEQYTYDSNNRLNEVATPNGGTWVYEYDNSGHVTRRYIR